MCKEEEGSVTVRPCGHKYCPGIVASDYDCECDLDVVENNYYIQDNSGLVEANFYWSGCIISSVVSASEHQELC